MSEEKGNSQIIPAGIEVVLVEEAFTSGTSFLDGEMPSPENYNKRRRVKRGLFRSNTGIYINADVNAAYQIMKCDPDVCIFAVFNQ